MKNQQYSTLPKLDIDIISSPFNVCMIAPSATLIIRILCPTAATNVLPSGEKHASYALICREKLIKFKAFFL